jgi:hypothetical protein
LNVPKHHFLHFQLDKLIRPKIFLPLGKLILAPSKINAAEEAQDKSLAFFKFIMPCFSSRRGVPFAKAPLLLLYE